MSVSLPPGSRFGSYEVSSQIGLGGMGEVYQATDTRLKRQVALKILPAAVATDPDRLARFQREAEVLAALNHPNIAAIHGLEESDSMKALVMELVEGPTLAERIALGPVPLGESLAIAKGIAEALEAAHAQGIVHRDLKPANIKVRSDGTVKVLDFGLAKALEPATAGTTVSRLATITTPALMTGAGVILGTAAYMSPEQARGKAVDKRADNWAFGCVLFEMLSGTRAFGGDEVPDVLAKVLAREPNWGALPDGLPALVRRLVVRCLTKDPQQRLHDIADARLDLQDAIAAPDRDDRSRGSTPGTHRRWWIPALAAAGALLIGVAAGAAMWRRPQAPGQVTRAILEATPADEVGTTSTLSMLPAGARTALAWSPSGQTLAFIGSQAGTQQIFLRDLDAVDARPLEGTQGARALAYSPDGEWIAFWTDGELRRVRVSGGPPTRVCAAPGLNGLTWGATRIVFTARNQVFEVAPAGGEPRLLTGQGDRRSSPLLLPGEHALLYTEYGKAWTSGDERVMIQPLAEGASPTVLLREAADARYLPTGHLAFLRQGTLFVVPFDAPSLELRGDAVPVLSSVAQAVAAWNAGDLTLAGQFAISPHGTLAYVASPSMMFPMSELVRVNRRGEVTPLAAPPNSFRERVEGSPDGARLAVSVQSTRDVRLFVYDIIRGTLTPSFAQQADREAVRPVWSSDGRIAVHFIQAGGSAVGLLRADSPAAPEEIASSGGFAPNAWSQGGDALIGTQDDDLWVYGADSTWQRLTDTPAVERFPAWSSDGRWLTYVSNVSGRDEVYVEPFPGPGRAVLVSTSGGLSPLWNPARRELLYVEFRPGEPGEWRLMAVEMANPLVPGRPAALFDSSSASLLMAQCSPSVCYSLAPDGESLYTLRLRPRQPARVTGIQLVLNWFDEVGRLAPLR